MKNIFLSIFSVFFLLSVNSCSEPEGPFYIAENGITIKARDTVKVGTQAMLNGITYTLVDDKIMYGIHWGELPVDSLINDSSQIVTTSVTKINMGSISKYRFAGSPPEWTDTFNLDIGSWDVSNVTDMSYMFRNSFSFNQDIGSWDVSNVKKMRGMFLSAASFNQDISNWDVSNVTDMNHMFRYSGFNQDISKWKIKRDSAGWFRAFSFKSPLIFVNQPDFYSTSQLDFTDGVEEIIDFYQSLDLQYDRYTQLLSSDVINKMRNLNQKRVNALGDWNFKIALQKIISVEYDENSGNKTFTVNARYSFPGETYRTGLWEFFLNENLILNQEIVVLDSDNNILDWYDVGIIWIKGENEFMNVGKEDFYKVMGENLSKSEMEEKRILCSSYTSKEVVKERLKALGYTIFTIQRYDSKGCNHQWSVTSSGPQGWCVINTGVRNGVVEITKVACQ